MEILRHLTKGTRTRFWSYVNRMGRNDCWQWTGGTTLFGYGQFFLRSKRETKRVLEGAHRVSLVMKLGRDIRSDFCSLHTCDNPACVNPDHLWEGTIVDNNLDMGKKGRRKGNASSERDKGESHVNSKLTNEIVLSIVEGLKKGIPQSKLAKKFKISQSIISRIRTGKSWSHVTKRNQNEGRGV